MSEFPLWSNLIAKEDPTKLQEMYPSPIGKDNPAPIGVAEGETLNPRSPILSAGARVRVPHKGRMVTGKVVRYDKGGYVSGVRNGGWPFYVIDVGEYESVKVPIDKVMKEEITEAEMTDAQMKKREEIVMSMKDKEADFKDRYGDRWKEVMYATATKQAMGEAVQRPLKVGDYVHAGLAVKGGAGFSGRVDKIDGNHVYVNVSKDKSVQFKNDPLQKWGDRIIKAPIKNVSLQEAEHDTKYQEYFRAQLKKHGYDSPADIPDDKKDDFFNVVDKGYSAKNEEMPLQPAHQYGVRAVDAQEADEPISNDQESDDQDMMSSQLDSLAQKSATLHDILSQMALGDVPAWIQTKIATADKDISAVLDYMKYEETEPVSDEEPITEADEKDAMVPLRMQAAMVIAKSLGTVKGSGQIGPDMRVSGGTPESIVNQAIRVWLSGSHTNEGWALGAKMLKLAKSMGIKWDEKLVRQKLAPITLKKLGLAEADGDSSGPSAMEKLTQRQAQEKMALELRQEREKITQQQRDANDKIQQQQLKQAEVQRKQNRSVR